jgi:NADPH2:quinone reductase
VALAQQAGARVLATVRSEGDAAQAARAGASEVVQVDGRSPEEVVGRLRALAPDGINHIVEVAFDTNIAVDAELLAVGGSLAAYATGNPSPGIPFWPLVFKNIRVFFLGSDDFPAEAKAAAADGLNAALEAGWPGFEISRRFPLSAIAEAHEYVEGRRGSGRVVVMLSGRSSST